MAKKVPNGHDRRDILRRQAELVSKLSNMASKVRAMKEPRLKKIDLLRAKLSEPKRKLQEFDPLSLPLDPTKQVVGIIPS
jgi:phosphatidylinositol 3-kinase